MDIVKKDIGGNAEAEVVLYQPDSSIHIEVLVEGETVWLTQQQIADLFGTKRPAITKHLSNIFNSGELDKDSVSSILEHTAADGKTYKTLFYNLDAILSVGYRVNSINATSFRRWASTVLKQYLLRGYAVQQQIQHLERQIFQLGLHMIQPTTVGKRGIKVIGLPGTLHRQRSVKAVLSG